MIGQQSVGFTETAFQFGQFIQHRLDFLHIVGLLGQCGGYDQHAVDIDGRLTVVGLNEAFVPGHDAKFFVG